MLQREPAGLELKLEVEERIHNHTELFPLQHRTGTRRYLHAKPYMLETKITLTVGLYLWEHRSVIGEVTDSEWRRLRRREVGQAQARYYPADRILSMSLSPQGI